MCQFFNNQSLDCSDTISFLIHAAVLENIFKEGYHLGLTLPTLDPPHMDTAEKHNFSCEPLVLYVYEVSSKAFKLFWRKCGKCEVYTWQTNGHTDEWMPYGGVQQHLTLSLWLRSAKKEQIMNCQTLFTIYMYIHIYIDPWLEQTFLRYEAYIDML